MTTSHCNYLVLLGNEGLLFASAQNWNELRKFTLKSLREHGFGKKTAETFILEESSYMVEYLR